MTLRDILGDKADKNDKDATKIIERLQAYRDSLVSPTQDNNATLAQSETDKSRPDNQTEENQGE